ncbi:DUF6175 family protein [uncultured Bacteroides sp.]|uniref:DUF6175 family protein n=1 Tax=uncultured Bacteroides sp. TaxID=162156 RepID=UPI0023D4C828|nr:DUF6175 family protein [uncultured Bacteroides sp.]MDE5710372.1 hypothetical protein [Bacteroides sp.]
MKHCGMFLLGVILCVNLYAQNYSNEVTLVHQDENSVTVRATATAAKKKDAAVLATKSAFYTLFHAGVPGVKGGVPMMAVEKKDFDYRFFSESRYISYIGGEVNTKDDEKIAGQYRVTVQVNIKLKSLCAELERNKLALNPGWSDAKAVNATAALNPTIVVVPYTTAADGYDFDSMRKKVEASQLNRFVINRVSEEFRNNGYKTRDFINQLQNSKTSALLRADAQTDDATMAVQLLPGDIVVIAEVQFNTDASRNSECTLNLRALEKQTDGELANMQFTSGQYMTTDSIRLASDAIKKIRANFFKQLQGSFEDMIKKGREVVIEISLSQSVDDWDFEQDSPATGDYFKDTLDEWLREHAFQGVPDIKGTDKFVSIRLNIPLWNLEKNRSYTLSNFGSDIRKFFKAQLGDDYKAVVTSMGQKLLITIE